MLGMWGLGIFTNDMGKGVMIRNGSVRDRKTKWETSDMNAFII